MAPWINPETDFRDKGEILSFLRLPPILPHFFIPLLDDKPQDPVVSAINLKSSDGAPSNSNPDEEPQLLQNVPFSHLPLEKNEPSDPLWNQALMHPRHLDHRVSWGCDCTSLRNFNANTPLLTEQSPRIYDTIQQHILSPLHDRKSVIVHHTEDELMESLKLVVLGSSSPLYIWNVPSESFVHKRSADIEQVIVRVSGQTEAAGTSYLRRFLNLGSLMRRMDIFVHDLRHRRDATSTVHAFAYGLSTLLNFFRHQISNTPLFKDHDFSISCDRAAEWLHCAEYEEIVNCLATMCHRHLDILPENYREFPTATVDILNVVYEMLEYHFKLASSHLLIAVIAYLLTVTSQPYLAELRQSVIHSKNRRWRAKLKEEVHVPGASVLFEGEEQEGTSEDDDSLEVDSSFPTFIPNDLADILPAAGRSLRLLEAAQPSHNLLSETAAPREILWLWSDAEIRHAWNDVHGLESVFTSLLIEPSLVKQTDDSSSVLDQFKVFVLEPGTRGSNEDEDRNARSVISKFIADFPEALPAVTPNLPLLCELVFSPLQSHATLVSSALLTVFLDRSTFFCVESHLLLLRSHLLLTSHTFKSRLAAALFSDTDEPSNSVNWTKSRHPVSGQTRIPSTYRQPSATKAIGLSPYLTKDTWPPGGSDLSFLLRTIIIDAQESRYQYKQVSDGVGVGMSRIIEEAEFRLGFAIRDLPVGTGGERWLNPLNIEALDFLYLDYKVPHPMETLIPQAVLSKYQRIFTFLLRLMRVEAAIRVVFRLTRTLSTKHFDPSTASTRLLLRFRFLVHSFISALSTYIYDAAIGGNFDAFLSRIAACRDNMDANAPHEFRDVFALAESHSAVLDDILSACLLRSSQRAAGDVLRSAMELVLEFCVLIGDISDGQVEERKAASSLETLHTTFRKRIAALVKVLELLLEKDTKASQMSDLWAMETEERRVPPGGAEALRLLLARLDLGNWWKMVV